MGSRIPAVVAATLLLGFVAPPAYAAGPDAPALVSPATGSTATGTDVALAVTASDPDGGTLSVRFEGRRTGATVPGGGSGVPFTIVALPDTQNYTYNNRQATMTQQTQWAVDTRATLNTAVVVQLGDLVSEYDNLAQWGRTSTAFQVLDDAAMPNTVIGGNHDFNNATGDATQYNTYFPPSRYAGKAWTPSTSAYGGYLGQNLFGPDPVDRHNMDNFALFSAGGRDFVVLNLEWEAPQYALDWGAKVLAAYPDRLAILTTHAFVGINGQRKTTAERPGGTPANQMWTSFVSQQCQIRLVLSGHFHDGNAGEANRSDLNACGQPVQQVLTDYQDRANGGDGWLRYYTVDPTAGTMTATTYSPKLDQYETDADSAFTVPFAIGEPQPAPFTPIATVPVASGGTATTTWTGLDADTDYEWRAVSSDGADAATSATWTFRTPPRNDYVDDTFSRNVSNGWGAADASHPWTTKSTASNYSVDGSKGLVTAAVGATRGATLSGVQAGDVRLTTDIALAAAATGSGTYVSLHGRLIGTNSYRAKLRYLAGGSLSLSLIRYTGSEISLAAVTVPGVTVTPGTPIRLVLQLEGTSPTTLRAKAWPVSGTEPGWQVSATDSTAALQAAGSTGIDVYTSSSAAAASTVSVDRFTASRLGAPPANQPPNAVIASPTITNLKADLSATGSSDPDGTITAYQWDFGDTTTGTGPTTSHTYTTAGTYTVTLTVTDNNGATDTATRQVSVTAPPAGAFAKDDFGRTVANGWGTADTGGAWTVSGTSSQYSVGGGVGRQAITTPGATTTASLGGSAAETDLRVTMSWNRTAAAGTLYASVLPRRLSSSNDYRCKVVVSASGAMRLDVVRRLGGTETTLSFATISGLTQAAGQEYVLACRVTASGAATQVSGKLWRAGTTEPGSWQVSGTDSTAALQGAGGIGLSAYNSSGATQPVTISFDAVEAVDPTP
ncbi:MAG: PKD domain-containing protein [Actinobacteria bacterium]|nr:PKD domain-containing protein [Actinomycetota bacterium]